MGAPVIKKIHLCTIGCVLISGVVPAFLLVEDFNFQKIFGVLSLYLGLLWIVSAGRLLIMPGTLPAILLSLIPIVVHHYLELGWLFSWAIAFMTFTVGVHEKAAKHYHRLVLFLSLVLIGLVALELVATRDFSFMRNLNLAIPSITRMTPLRNPNLFSRTVVILTPLLIFWGAYGIKMTVWNCMVLTALFSTVLFVAVSKTNMLALLVMVMVLYYYGHKREKYKMRRGFMIVLVLIVISMFGAKSSLFQRELASTSQVISQTITGVLDFSWSVPEYKWKRAKVWIASIVVIQEHPLFGVGNHGKEKISELGAVAKDRDGQEYDLAVHGGLLNILVSKGFVGGGLFLWLVVSVVRYLNRGARKYGSRVAPYGVAFVIATLVSQIGADIYAQPIYWATLGILMAATRMEIRQTCKKSTDIASDDNERDAGRGSGDSEATGTGGARRLAEPGPPWSLRGPKLLSSGRF